MGFDKKIYEISRLYFSIKIYAKITLRKSQDLSHSIIIFKIIIILVIHKKKLG